MGGQFGIVPDLNVNGYKPTDEFLAFKQLYELKDNSVIEDISFHVVLRKYEPINPRRYPIFIVFHTEMFGIWPIGYPINTERKLRLKDLVKIDIHDLAVHRFTTNKAWVGYEIPEEEDGL